MIVRFSSVAIPESKLNHYLESLRENETSRYEDAPGLISFCVLQRPFAAYAEILTISFWQSEQTLDKFLEGHSAPQVVLADYGAIRLEARNYTVLIFAQGRAPATDEVTEK